MNMAAKNGLRCLVLFCIVAFAVGLTVDRPCPKTDKSCVEQYSVEQYSVELDIYSGRPNPKWVINKSNKFFAKIDKDAPTILPSRPPAILGYRGFYIEASNRKGQKANIYIGAGTNPSFEKVLFDSRPSPSPAKTSPAKTSPPQISKPNKTSKKVRVRRAGCGLLSWLGQLLCTSTPHQNTNNENSNSATNHGYFDRSVCTIYNEPKQADFSTNPRFDPERWNTNRYIKGSNNCYNYATQRRTDTVAQPGRATRNPLSPPDFTSGNLTAEQVIAASVRDGFEYAGTDHTIVKKVPPTPHDTFCYMALVIWLNNDFHWYRRDNDGTWSHKRGAWPATNLDDAKKRIRVLKDANMSKYTFAGYFKNFWGPDLPKIL